MNNKKIIQHDEAIEMDKKPKDINRLVDEVRLGVNFLNRVLSEARGLGLQVLLESDPKTPDAIKARITETIIKEY